MTKPDFSSLQPVEEPIKILGKDYIVREASEAAATSWRNHSIAATKIDDGKTVGFSGLADAEPLLVSLCLFENNGHGMIGVPLETVLAWPSRIVTPLYNYIKEISGLDKEEKLEESEAKN
jgi:hypothetical protein